MGEGERNLPQGAPTSPSITNIICRRLDKRLQGMAKSIGFTYTRYADDLTFSADRENGKKLGKLKFRLQQILNDEGVILHPDKTRVMRNNNKQEVTGIVVNDKLSIDRKTLKRFRATLFQIEKDGPENKKWGNTSNVLSAIKGYANYVFMVDPEKGKILLARVEKIYKLYGKKPTFTHPTELSAKNLRTQSAKGKAARENWWTPKEKTQPVAEKLPENKIPKIKREENNRRSTADIVDDAQRGIPKANGLIKMIFKSMWFVIKSFFWIALFTFFIIKLATTSGPLTTIFVIAAVYFVLSLFSKR